MKEHTINENQLAELESIIWMSDALVKAHRRNEQNSVSDEMKDIFNHLANTEECRLAMACDILSALGLSYDPDTCRIIKKIAE